MSDGVDRPAFALTRLELEEMIRAAVRDEMMKRPALIDKQQLAQQLLCSAAHIDHLRKRGLPTLYVGQAVRFDLSAVLDWLRVQRPSNDS